MVYNGEIKTLPLRANLAECDLCTPPLPPVRSILRIYHIFWEQMIQNQYYVYVFVPPLESSFFL